MAFCHSDVNTAGWRAWEQTELMNNTYLDLSRPMTFPMIFAWIATSLSPWLLAL